MQGREANRRRQKANNQIPRPCANPPPPASWTQISLREKMKYRFVVFLVHNFSGPRPPPTLVIHPWSFFVFVSFAPSTCRATCPSPAGHGATHPLADRAAPHCAQSRGVHGTSRQRSPAHAPPRRRPPGLGRQKHALWVCPSVCTMGPALRALRRCSIGASARSSLRPTLGPTIA